MKFEKRLKEQVDIWREQGIITPEQAGQIGALYPENKGAGYKIALILFSVLGALLVGGGFILILGRNWDELPTWLRLCIAFLPLLASQAATGWVLAKKITGIAWREGVGVFYAISVYACVAMIGQTYHLPGSFSGYLLLCSLLILPVGYVLKATVPMLIYMAGVTVWVNFNTVYHGFDLKALYYVGLIAFALPHIWVKAKKNIYSVYSQLLLWVACVCGFAFVLNTVAYAVDRVLVCSLYFSIIYLAGAKWMTGERGAFMQPFKIVGFLGGVIQLILMSGSYSQYMIGWLEYHAYAWPQYIVIGLMLLAWIALMIASFDKKRPVEFVRTMLMGCMFLIPLAILVLNAFVEHSVLFFGVSHFLIGLFVNLYVLAIGVLLIMSGMSRLRLSRAVCGTALITLMIFIRFFDTDTDFLVRGLVFIVLGVAFLVSNLFIGKRIKKEAGTDA